MVSPTTHEWAVVEQPPQELLPELRGYLDGHSGVRLAHMNVLFPSSSRAEFDGNKNDASFSAPEAWIISTSLTYRIIVLPVGEIPCYLATPLDIRAHTISGILYIHTRYA